MNFKDIKNTLLRFDHLLESIGYHYIYARQFKRYLKINNIPNKKVHGEIDYINKWKQLSKHVEPYSYRLFSRYCGNTTDIIPEDIGRTIIEPILNNCRYQDYYCDKNLYSEYLKKDILPKTVLCRIGGSLILNDQFVPVSQPINSYLNNYNKVILKPSIDTSSGIGVELYQKTDNQWINVKNRQNLTFEYLNKYGSDFILQEALEQHSDMSFFNPSSVNTIRIGTYRSVKDEKVYILGSLIRIGKNGEIMDNAHAGGKYVGINPETGVVGNCAYDQYGQKTNIWNNVDFSTLHYRLPSWDKVIELAKYIGKKIIHARLLALDICVDKNGNPKLVEFNVDGYSYWLYEFVGQKGLGDFTDEIIEYCKLKKK